MDQNHLSKRQKEILEYIVAEVEKRGYPPSVREIGKAVGLNSTSTVHSHLTALEKKGYIRRDPLKPRALEIISNVHKENQSSSQNIRNLPLVGRVAAGQPILAQQNIEDEIAVPADIADDNSFILKVKGNSMIDAGIFDGDYIIVKQQQTAVNGDIVVALIDDEATVKRFYKRGSYVELKPENRHLEPIITQNVKILGKVIGLIRKY